MKKKYCLITDDNLVNFILKNVNEISSVYKFVLTNNYYLIKFFQSKVKLVSQYQNALQNSLIL